MLSQHDLHQIKNLLSDSVGELRKEMVTKSEFELKISQLVTKEDFEMKMKQIETEMVTQNDFLQFKQEIKTEINKLESKMVTHGDLQKAVDEIIDYTKTCFKTSEVQLANHEKRIVKLENQKVILVSQ